MHKLYPKWFGLFKVTNKLGAVTYRLNLPPTWKLHNMFHVSLLSPYCKTREHGTNHLLPAPELVEGEHKWEVEEVLASQHHGRHNQLQYLVHWVGYPELHNSWELAENLQMPRLLKQFHKDHPTVAKSIKLTSMTAPKKQMQPVPLPIRPDSECQTHPSLPTSMTYLTPVRGVASLTL